VSVNGRLAVANYRGVRVPRTLGLLLLTGAAVATLAFALAGEVGAPGWGSLAGIGLVFAAGLADDLAPPGPRGLRNHLRALLEGRVTTGIVKVVVAIGAAVVVVALEPRRPAAVELAGVVLVAASTNVWNGLDVRPGRALKAFLPAALVFLLAGDPSLAPAVVGLFAGAVVALPLDLGERAMLGDGGSNALGFAAGLGLYLVLPGWTVALAAALAIALNLLAETVSLSRAIDAVAPLRWLDRLGRRPEPRD
jgi:UDP-GlcNAc:undecaprenyl-phosphate/decaprenyl-phosphate GlcNAc-1-phosphate transferase